MHPQACFRYLLLSKLAALLLVVAGVGESVRVADAAPAQAAAIADKGRADGANDEGKPLDEFLPGTKWLWYGRDDQVLEFRKNGEFDLAVWAQQGITAVWKASGPNEVTVTVTSEKYKDLTATLNFNKDRSSFTGADLDKNTEIPTSPRVDDRAERELAEFIAGTRWLWYGKSGHVLELRRGGKFDLPAWTQQGIAAVWKATGGNQVTVTVTSEKFKNLTATLDFDARRTAFTGTDLEKTRKITRSPRIGRDNH